MPYGNIISCISYMYQVEPLLELEVLPTPLFTFQVFRICLTPSWPCPPPSRSQLFRRLSTWLSLYLFYVPWGGFMFCVFWGQVCTFLMFHKTDPYTMSLLLCDSLIPSRSWYPPRGGYLPGSSTLATFPLVFSCWVKEVTLGVSWQEAYPHNTLWHSRLFCSATVSPSS